MLALSAPTGVLIAFYYLVNKVDLQCMMHSVMKYSFCTL